MSTDLIIRSRRPAWDHQARFGHPTARDIATPNTRNSQRLTCIAHTEASIGSGPDNHGEDMDWEFNSPSQQQQQRKHRRSGNTGGVNPFITSCRGRGDRSSLGYRKGN
ncbi:hypothetical protein GE21DRAFT_3680 [Neurospora crassa]|uniref:Uncharacterized protein n=1 Tax=Neurospora crassa (strain ATCC 24698 / 74-OR23-1A / CBS 708.71 / DSM 1257 / FGSC 987) TaxID=367110 RepID=Q7S2P3_NEUCR|nr:hypothetical protein NCU09344 [Neurospora crassa OR74A]EAA29687.1 hypothetical protein NCU09344 [Neurospora crassa OR74A]KHE87264.1 hypothetical protein GE21DRAFT_3680 [Neurospora crassa]|eukprot:XP_958923.1 hypothetical protein NCU09344 [Neurospora crassa OR74A]